MAQKVPPTAGMDIDTLPLKLMLRSAPAAKDARGIVIADGGLGARLGLRAPLVRAFIYGEEPPTSPTLPFGRWKEAG